MTDVVRELEEKATAIFLKREHWRAKYEKAPSGAKEYYRLMFALSLGLLSTGEDVTKKVDASEERDRLYHSMDDESWDYILANAGHAEALGLAIVRKHMQGHPEVKCGSWITKK